MAAFLTAVAFVLAAMPARPPAAADITCTVVARPELYWEALWLPPRMATADRWRVWLCADWWWSELRPGAPWPRPVYLDPPVRAWKPAGPRPEPFADRDYFLADLFGPYVEWLPPRTASADDWRTWLNAISEPESSTCCITSDNGISSYHYAVDPWVFEWLTTVPPGPSWLTLTNDGRWPDLLGLTRREAGRLDLARAGRPRTGTLTP